ncbi:MAG TPA: HypC/HybG/HupF family hydrogenase formation chaperone [Burkholderiales bacterium]|nr:HypC/HybG/HupF family hydrogenase formation chaperone [Burkholderiales bacterium]
MCIAIPMQVISCNEVEALCEGRGERQRLNILLIGPQAPGAWVMSFLGTAREVITPQQAQEVNQALDALEAALRGDTANLDAFFPDLVNRQPQLPEHLRKEVAE